MVIPAPGPVAIEGHGPDCPVCETRLQAVPVGGQTVWRCPWSSDLRWAKGLVAGVEVVSCDWPLRRSPDSPQGGPSGG